MLRGKLLVWTSLQPPRMCHLGCTCILDSKQYHDQDADFITLWPGWWGLVGLIVITTIALTVSMMNAGSYGGDGTSPKENTNSLGLYKGAYTFQSDLAYLVVHCYCQALMCILYLQCHNSSSSELAKDSDIRNSLRPLWRGRDPYSFQHTTTRAVDELTPLALYFDCRLLSSKITGVTIQQFPKDSSLSSCQGSMS